MRMFSRIIIIMALAVAQTALASDHFIGDVAVLATVKAKSKGFYIEPERYREFEIEREKIVQDFADQCPLDFQIHHSSADIAGGESEGAIDLADGYWIIIHIFPYAYYDRDQNLTDYKHDAYIEHLNNVFPECGGEIYRREVHIIQGRTHPSCLWAAKNDDEFHNHYCLEGQKLYNGLIIP